MIIRFVLAPLILIWPLQSVILSFFLDVIDGDFAPYLVTRKQYQDIDKALDFWVVIFEMIYAWEKIPEFKYFLLALLGLRLIGLIIFYITKKRWVFIIFSNYFEFVFLIAFLKIIFINLTVTLVVAFVLKTFQEWFIHVAKLSFVEDILGKKRKWKK